ncbi:MAG: hypothetical protein LH630_05800 [Actinomycetia bacterium]|nr:hypothetical protein [Actinomycetes bacterium]
MSKSIKGGRVMTFGQHAAKHHVLVEFGLIRQTTEHTESLRLTETAGPTVVAVEMEPL